MRIELDWNQFSARYLLENRIFVLERDDSWVFFTNDDIFIIRCVVEKNADHTENVMFVERYLSGRNIVKVDEIDEETEQFPEEIFEMGEENISMGGEGKENINLEVTDGIEE